MDHKPTACHDPYQHPRSRNAGDPYPPTPIYRAPPAYIPPRTPVRLLEERDGEPIVAGIDD